MTPLALRLMKDLTTPGAFREWCIADTLFPKFSRDWFELSQATMGRDGYWKSLNDSHFFDLTAVDGMVRGIASQMRQAYEDQDLWSARRAFLPAVQTWLEFERPFKDGTLSSARQAYVITGSDSRHNAHFSRIMVSLSGEWTHYVLGKLPLNGDGRRPDKAEMNFSEFQIRMGEASRDQFLVYAALAIINSPRVIARQQHMPHERAERERLKALDLVGKFPLRAWTEIILKVAPPDDRTGEPSTEAHLTGEKCLHFCRTHLRVRLGQLEYVEGHWRGNPALGIKQSRYRLEK